MNVTTRSTFENCSDLKIQIMEIVTYSLRNGRARSDQYYRDVADFTDELLSEAGTCLNPLVEAFQAYLLRTSREPPRTKPEYYFELLMSGCLWIVYAHGTPEVTAASRKFLSWLTNLRKRGAVLKTIADSMRGVLANTILSPGRRRSTRKPELTIRQLDRLLGWLEATDIFKEEVKRLSAWRDFLAGETPEAAAKALEEILAFASWFEERSAATLGCYTPEVETFLEQKLPSYRWREDYIFCGRHRLEYHLNMVGTEILNRAFREKFLSTKRKIVIAPPCMRARPEAECKARQTNLGQQCAGCTPGCQVNQLTRLGEKSGFSVLIIPDDLAVFSGGASAPSGKNEFGVIGISCVLTNAPGGWETCNLGVPAQGVLLDFCGCHYHWHRHGIPTEINFAHLIRVAGLEGKGEA